MALTRIELQILRFVRGNGPSTVADFVDKNPHGYDEDSKVTVRLAMKRLASQGFLKSARDGKAAITFALTDKMKNVDYDSLSEV